jgi:hypothetical protein
MSSSAAQPQEAEQRGERQAEGAKATSPGQVVDGSKKRKNQKKKRRKGDKKNKREVASAAAAGGASAAGEAAGAGAGGESKRSKKRQKKRRKVEGAGQQDSAPGAADTPDAGAEPPAHSWVVEDADHCETPREAYADIAACLRRLAARLKVQPQNLRIYDPYFCTGAVVGHLRSLGFKHVINHCVDFYEAWETGRVPEFDVIVTNPPYSEDHIPRCLQFCQETGVPWFALLPNFVFTKDWFLESGLKPVYIVPQRRYVYKSPDTLRPSMEGAGSRSRVSPYVSLWYADLREHMSAVAASELDRGTYARASRAAEDEKRPLLCWNHKEIPQKMRDQNDPGRRRLRKKQRDRLKRRAVEASEPSAASAAAPPPGPGPEGSSVRASAAPQIATTVTDVTASWQGKHKKFED